MDVRRRNLEEWKVVVNEKRKTKDGDDSENVDINKGNTNYEKE